MVRRGSEEHLLIEQYRKLGKPEKNRVLGYLQAVAEDMGQV